MKKNSADLPSSSRILLFLGFASYAASFAFPLMSTILVTRAGLSSVSVGWLMCIAFLFSATLQPMIGSLLDEGKDRLVLGGAAAGILLGITGIYISEEAKAALIPALVVFITAFSAISTAASRILEGTATEESRGKVALILMGTVNFGFAVSSILAYFFLQTHQSLLLVLDAVTTLLFIGGLYHFRPRTGTAAVPAAGRGAAPGSSSPARGAAIGGSFLIFISTAACLSAIPLLYARQGQLGTQMAPLMFGICNVVVAVLGIGFASAINKIPLVQQIVISAVFFAVGHSLVPWVDSHMKNVIVTIFWSIGEVFAYPIAAKLIFSSYTPAEAGKAAGIKSSLMRLAMAATPALAALTVNSDPRVFSAVFGLIPLGGGVLLFMASRRAAPPSPIETPMLSLQNWIQSRFRKSLLLYLNIGLALIFSVNSFLILGEKLTQLYDASQTFISSQLPNLQVYDFTRMNSDLEIFARNKPLSAARMRDGGGLIIGRWSNHPEDAGGKAAPAFRLSEGPARSIDYQYNGGLGQLLIRTTEYDRSAAALAVLEVTVPCFLFLRNMLFSAAALLLVMILTYSFGLRLARLSAKTASGPLEDLSKALQTAEQPDDLAALQITTEIAEAAQLVERFRSLGKRLQGEERRRVGAERSEAIGKIAAQVAHDIRSPLAALEIVAGDVAQLPEDKRILIRAAVGRIRDIANSLLNKQRAEAVDIPPTAPEPASPQLLSSLIDPIVSEMRLQFRSQSRVEIELRLDASSYGLFAAIQPVEFRRMISNLVNNSVEAFIDGAGAVSVGLSCRDGRSLVSVRDNGKGIPPEILARLGRRGETHGKVGGSGLGLNHARTSAESWGGNLEITSEVGKGTTATVFLPQAPAPEWFVPELALMPGRAVVILDDDASIHQVWQGRLDALKASELGVHIVHVSTPEEIRAWVKSEPEKATEALYLFDYELIGYRETGLKLVEELAIGPRAVLVTSRHEEPAILDECRRLKTRLIPKGSAGLLPIRISAIAPATGLARESLDAILIDDDALSRMNWTLAARGAGKKLRAFSTAADFLKESGSIDLSTPVYVDAELGDGVKGDIESLKFHALGFSEIYLATGHEPEKFAGLSHLRGVLGKEPPWS